MQIIRDKTFVKRLWHDGQLIADYCLENCTFEGPAGLVPRWSKWFIRSHPDPRRRPTLRNITLRNTNVYDGDLEGVILEDVTVDGTKGGRSPLFLRGNAYRHVILKGRIAATEIRGKFFPPLWDDSKFPDAVQQQIRAEWDAANAKFYEQTDWALDITQATYGSLSIEGIPARLIRRNPATTAVVTQQRALEGRWRDLEYRRGVFHWIIGRLLEEGYDDVVLIACPKSKRFKDDLADLETLREAGVAE